MLVLKAEDGAEKHVPPVSTLTGRTMESVDHTIAVDPGRGDNPCKQKHTSFLVINCISYELNL